MLYPIGQQDFASIRKGGFVYVDKTALVYKMAKEGKYYFLSRPRRFGKSLLLSTIEYYFQGRQDLFAGLAIEQLETEWAQYPVLHLNLAYGKFDTMEDLYSCLRDNFSCIEDMYGRNREEIAFAERFSGAIRRAYEQTGRQAVVLVDEYDAPLQAALDKPELLESYQSELRSLYLCLKNNDKYIRFAMLTGITAWGKMGVFSTLNNLKDISMTEAYATLCGITEAELKSVFHEEVLQLAAKNKMTVAEAYQRLKEQYDGYHFAAESEGVYNPFSLLNALDDKVCNNYWVQTGATQLVATLVKNMEIDVDELLCGDIRMSRENLLRPDAPYDTPYTFLYQAGYLTLSDSSAFFNGYRLQVPNGEVRNSLACHLMPVAFGLAPKESETAIWKIQNAIVACEIAELVDVLNDSIFRKEHYKFKDKQYEKFFQHVLYIVLISAGFEVQAEAGGHTGIADLVVKSPYNIYVIELKRNETAQAALDQINRNGYADPYKSDKRPVVKLGLNFSEEERIITDYAVEVLPSE